MTKHVPYPLCSKSTGPKSCLHTRLTFPLPQFPIKRLPRVILKGFYQKSENPKNPKIPIYDPVYMTLYIYNPNPNPKFLLLYKKIAILLSHAKHVFSYNYKTVIYNYKEKSKVGVIDKSGI